MASALDPYSPAETAARPASATSLPQIPGLDFATATDPTFAQGQQQVAGAHEQQLRQQALQQETQQRTIQAGLAQDQRTAQTAISAYGQDPELKGKGYYQLNPHQVKRVQTGIPASQIPQIPGMFNDVQSAAAGHPVGGKIGEAEIASGKANGIEYSQLDPTGAPGADNGVEPTTFNGQVQGFVRRQLPLSALPKSGPMKQRLLSAILAADPTFTPQDYEAQQKARDAFVGQGKNAQSILSANTLVGHLAQANDLVDAMNGGGSPLVNKIGNAIGDAAGTQAANARNQFTTAAHTAATEYAKMLSGGIPGEQEIKNYENLLSPNLSPQMLKTNIQQMAHAMGERMGNLQSEWNNTVKSQRDVPFLTPEARANLAKLGINDAAVDPVGANPRQTQPTAPAIPQAAQQGGDKFQTGKTYIDGKGNRATYLGNGKWQ